MSRSPTYTSVVDLVRFHLFNIVFIYVAAFRQPDHVLDVTPVENVSNLQAIETTVEERLMNIDVLRSLF